MVGNARKSSNVGQGLRQWCVLASLLFNMLFTAVLRVTEKCADAAITDMVRILRKKMKGENKGKPRGAKSTGGWGRRKRRRRMSSGVYCTLIMRVSYRDHQAGWRGWRR